MVKDYQSLESIQSLVNLPQTVKNMKNSAVLALCCICFFAAASAIPIFDEPANYRDELLAVWEPVGEVIPVESERFKRATCDLLSVSTPWVTLNHSACAAHCLTKRYKGGYCENGVCHCRN